MDTTPTTVPSIDDVLAILRSDVDRCKMVLIVVAFVEDSFSKHDTESVNTLFHQMPLVRPINASVAFLRCAYHARHLLPAWADYRDAVRKVADTTTDKERGGRSTERLMVGLLE